MPRRPTRRPSSRQQRGELETIPETYADKYTLNLCFEVMSGYDKCSVSCIRSARDREAAASGLWLVGKALRCTLLSSGRSCCISGRVSGCATSHNYMITHAVCVTGDASWHDILDGLALKSYCSLRKV